MNYYVVMPDGQEAGPFDVLALIRKVKNGSLTPDSILKAENSPQALPAKDIEEISRLFSGEEKKPAQKQNIGESYQLKALLQSGWRFFHFNQSSVIITGVFLITVVMAVLITSQIPRAGYLLSFVASFVIFAGYHHVISQMNHGRPVGVPDMFAKIKVNMAQLLLAGLVLSVPVTLGTILLIAPGLLILTLYIFTPLLIIDKGYGFWVAMEKSRRKAMNMGSNNFGVLFALVVLNFFAGIFLLPLLISLPVTMAAISDIFDRELSDS